MDRMHPGVVFLMYHQIVSHLPTIRCIGNTLLYLFETSCFVAGCTHRSAIVAILAVTNLVDESIEVTHSVIPVRERFAYEHREECSIQMSWKRCRNQQCSRSYAQREGAVRNIYLTRVQSRATRMIPKLQTLCYQDRSAGKFTVQRMVEELFSGQVPSYDFSVPCHDEVLPPGERTCQLIHNTIVQ